jgi:hypothetical protein
LQKHGKRKRNPLFTKAPLVAGDCGNPSLIPLLSGLLNKGEMNGVYRATKGTLNNKGFFPPHILDF